MRRPSVHRVELWTIPGSRRATYGTPCGLVGGADLLKLTGENNGAGRWCGNCYSGTHKVGYRPRPVPENRWTTHA